MKNQINILIRAALLSWLKVSLPKKHWIKIFLFFFVSMLSFAGQAQNIVRFEYFFDTDPGYGLGTITNVTPATTITDFDIPIATSSISPGFHKLYIRAQNATNQWTDTHTRSFYIMSFIALTNITQIEYFIDTDPGIGLATQVSLTAASTITNLAIDISALPLTLGFHKLYVRSKTSVGKWTHTHMRSFYIANVRVAQNLVKFEYFFDTEPGFDSGTAVAITPAAPSITNQDVFADATGLTIGNHTIYVRAKDSGGEWTQVSTGSFSVTAALLPTITSFTPTSGIAGTTVTITGTNFTGATAVTFGGTPATSFTVLSSNSISATVSTGTSGTISVTTPGGTATSSTNFTLSIPDLITILQQPSTTAVCEGSTASFTLTASGTTNLVYYWQKFNGTLFADLTNGSEYSGATSATLNINTTGNIGSGDYRCKVSGDNSQDKFSNTVALTISIVPTAPTVIGASACGATSLTLNALGGINGQYRWYTEATGGTAITGEINNSYVTPVVSTTTTYFVAINNGPCESLRTPVVATINIPPAIPAIVSSIPPVGNALTICSTASLTLTAPAGFAAYSWSTGATTQQISVSASGNYSVAVTDAIGCVSSTSGALVVTIIPVPCTNQAPVISPTTSSTVIGGLVNINLVDLISDADDNLVISSLVVLQPPGSGASTTITNGVLTINYSDIAFTGKDQLTIQVCDVFNECTQQILEIDVIGDIEIYNGISPNSDNQNEIFLIRYIDLLPDTRENKVTIYNRWGSKVFEISDYNNTTHVFRGLNTGGTELPSGTYFYKIEFGSGRKSETGYLTLKK